jgi:hypothetical protein
MTFDTYMSDTLEYNKAPSQAGAGKISRPK